VENEQTPAYGVAINRAHEHVQRAERLDEQLRHAATHPEDTERWFDAKKARDQFPRETELATAWAQIAQALK